MRIFLLSTFIFLTLALGSCGSQSSYKDAGYENESFAKTSAMTAAQPDAEYDEETGGMDTKAKHSEDITDTETKIIKTATVRIEVDNYNATIKQIQKQVLKFHATIISENEHSYGYGIENYMTISVKNTLFDSLLNRLINEQKVVSKEVSAQDVTEEYVDITTRLNSKKVVRDRYVELLKQAHNIKDIVTVEEQLRNIQEEIEAKEGRLKYLNTRVSFSTINLTIYEHDSNLYEPGFFKKIGNAVSGGWDGLKIFVIAMLYLWPLWLICVAVLIWLRYYLKKRKARKTA